MLVELRGAIDTGDWPGALDRALVLWRAQRIPALADVIDLIGAKLARPAPSQKRGAHAWWIEIAAAYDPADVARLIATAELERGALVTPAALEARHATNRLIRGIVAACEGTLPAFLHHGAWFDRLAYILDWADDPRWAPVLVRWLAERPPMSQWVSALRRQVDLGPVVRRFVTERLTELGDARVLPHVDDDLARELRSRVVTPTAAIAAELASLAAHLTPLSTRDASEEARLWAEVAAAPHDREPRLVLADYLVQHGDPRGELIALQCAGTGKATVRATKLLTVHLKSWLGPIAPLLTRRGCVWRDGMLAEIRVGTLGMPVAAIAAAPGHRELACVHTVVPADLAPGLYTTLLTGLPHVRRISIDAPPVVDALAASGRRWPFRVVELGSRDTSTNWAIWPPLLARIAAFAPDVETLILGVRPRWVAPLPPIYGELAQAHELFPKLVRICLPEQDVQHVPGALAYTGAMASVR